MGHHRSVVVEADGGSRGNPGTAAYGAVLQGRRDRRGDRRARGAHRRRDEQRRGVPRAHRRAASSTGEYADGADLEVRLDSKLVVEQMAGNWKIKHPSMRPLARGGQPARAVRHDVHLGAAGAEQARRPARQRGPRRARGRGRRRHAGRRVSVGARASGRRRADPRATSCPRPPWRQDAPTTLVLVRHGETDHTRARLFSGRTGADPALNDDGRAQVRATAEWLAPLTEQAPVLLSLAAAPHPGERRDRRERLGAAVPVDDGLPEAELRHVGGADLRRGGRARPRRVRDLVRRRRPARRRQRRLARVDGRRGWSRPGSGCSPTTRGQARRGGHPPDPDQAADPPGARDAADVAVPDRDLTGVGDRAGVVPRRPARRTAAQRAADRLRPPRRLRRPADLLRAIVRGR